MPFGSTANVTPLMKESVVGAPPSKGLLKKKVFGKQKPAKVASTPNPFGKASKAAPGSNLLAKLTGK